MDCGMWSGMPTAGAHLLKLASASATVEGKGLWLLLFPSEHAHMRKELFRTLLARGIYHVGNGPATTEPSVSVIMGPQVSNGNCLCLFVYLQSKIFQLQTVKMRLVSTPTHPVSYLPLGWMIVEWP